MTAVATDPSAAAPAATTLSAEPAERVAETRAPSSLVGVNRWIALGAALALHLAILAPIWLQFDWAPRAAPPSEEIPVEIVVEQPKPPPQPQPSPSSRRRRSRRSTSNPPMTRRGAKPATSRRRATAPSRRRTPRSRPRPTSRRPATRRRRATPPNPSSRLRTIRRKQRTTAAHRRRATKRSRSPSRRRRPPRRRIRKSRSRR